MVMSVSLGYLKKIAAEQGGFDIIVEMLANVNLNHDLPLLKPNGKVVVSLIYCTRLMRLNIFL